MLNETLDGAQNFLANGDDARCLLLLEGGPVLRVRMTMAVSALQIMKIKK
jgi:hypothetical protein